jgi:hypothetical protein
MLVLGKCFQRAKFGAETLRLLSRLGSTPELETDIEYTGGKHVPTYKPKEVNPRSNDVLLCSSRASISTTSLLSNTAHFILDLHCLPVPAASICGLSLIVNFVTAAEQLRSNLSEVLTTAPGIRPDWHTSVGCIFEDVYRQCTPSPSQSTYHFLPQL